MKYFYLFLLVLIAACGGKQNSETDNWETPSLLYKKADQGTSTRSTVTKSFNEPLKSDDQFEFYFRGDNLTKQKRIQDIQIQAECAEDSEMKIKRFKEFYSIGRQPIFSAYELLPPQALLDNSNIVFCKWTLVIVNETGSTRTYALPQLQLNNQNSQPKVKLSNSEGVELKSGSVVTFENNRGITFTSPEAGSFTSKLKCDLTTIEMPTNSALLSEYIFQKSDNDEIRSKHPMQRCLVEVKSSTGKIYRSTGILYYLFPRELTRTEISYAQIEEQIPMNNGMALGRARISNDSDQTRTFKFNSPNLPYDLLFFDDRHEPMGTGQYMNENFYRYQPKKNGIGVVGPDRKAQEVTLRPHEQADVDLYFFYSLNCGGGGEYSIAGLRLSLGNELFGERAPYSDKKGNVMDFPLPGTRTTQVVAPGRDNRLSPHSYFMKLIHAKLYGNPTTYKRNFVMLDSSC
jgi:hypothetical protein